MVIRFEYSKDFNTWTDNIDGKSIEDYTVLGSYDVRQGYNLSEIPRASTFTMDVVSDYALAQALIEYRYIRVYRDEEVAFIGQLSDESVRKIETLNGQVFTIKYIHLLNLLEKKRFGADDFELKYIEANGMKVLDNENPSHSLVHVLVNDYLLKDISIPFTFENSYSRLVNVIDFSVVGRDNVWNVLNQLLREYGYIIRIENLTLKTVDILKDSTEGIELLDGADISKRQTDEALEIPKVKYLTTMVEKDVIVYSGRFNFKSALWWGNTQEGDLTLSFDENDTKKMQSVSNIRHVAETASEDDTVVVYNNYLNEGHRTYHRGLELKGSGILQLVSGWETVKADVTYSIYKDSVSTDVLPAGFVQSEEYIEPKYLYSYDSVERYIKSLTRIKLFKKAEWKFYSKVELKVDDIVKFKDIPDSTCRIFEVQDTLEMDGGYTYRAYPYPVGEIAFVQKEELAGPPESEEIDSIYPKEPVFVENGTYRKQNWRIYIRTSMNLKFPTATMNNLPHEVKFDGKLGLFYIDVALSDTALNQITVKAKVDDSEATEVIPVYKTENRPAIQEYKYSTSSTDPEADSYRLEYNGYRLKFGDYSLGYGEGEWSQQIPVGLQYENMYLWKRTWNYNIDEWVYEMLTQIEEKFSLRASTNIYPISKRQVMDTAIILKVIQKGITGTPVVTASDGSLVESGNRQWTLTLPSQFAKDKVTVTATLGERTSEIVLNGVVQNDDEPVYFGKGDAPTGGRYVVGDFYLGNNNIPYRWNGGSWAELEATDSNYSEIMAMVDGDAFKDEESVIPSQSVIWQRAKHFFASNATTDNLTTKRLKVEDAIKKFKAIIKGEDDTPAVFDVQYDRGDGLQTIFKVVPSSGRIFMGRPNADATAPETGFMYDPYDDTISTKGGKFRVNTDGSLSAEEVIISGNATITSGYFSGQFNCSSIYTDIQETSSIIQDVSFSRDGNQAAMFIMKYYPEIVIKDDKDHYSPKIKCSLVGGRKNIYMQCGYRITNIGRYDVLEVFLIKFYDVFFNPLQADDVGLFLRGDGMDLASNSDSLQSRRIYRQGQISSYGGIYVEDGLAVEIYTGANILKLNVLEAPAPSVIDTLPHGQVYVDAEGNVKMKLKPSLP